jgi:hypothetical protein
MQCHSVCMCRRRRQSNTRHAPISALREHHRKQESQNGVDDATHLQYATNYCWLSFVLGSSCYGLHGREMAWIARMRRLRSQLRTAAACISRKHCATRLPRLTTFSSLLFSSPSLDTCNTILRILALYSCHYLEIHSNQIQKTLDLSEVRTQCFRQHCPGRVVGGK